MPESTRPVPAALWLAALLSVAWSLDPGVLWYLDNPSHLVEVDALAREILPRDGWFTGWSDAANLGHAVNQVNAPLVWAACGLLVWAGLPLGAVYQAGIVLSNVVFAAGIWRAGSRWLGERALPGAILATAWLSDLYGFGGAAAGMWPQRLANGILLWGLGAAPDDPRRLAPLAGIWIGLLLLCHTYTGMDGAWLMVVAVGLAWRAGDRARARALAIGAVIGALWTMPFWVPLLEEGLRPARGRGSFRVWGLQDGLAWALTSFHPMGLNDPRNWRFVGGWWGVAGTLGLLAGLAGWLARGRAGLLEIRRRLTEIPAAAWAAAALAAVVLGPIQWLELDALGPNPWRHLALVRALGLLVAGAALWDLLSGLCSRLHLRPAVAGWALALILGVCGGLGGRREVRLGEEREAVQAQLREVWARLDAALSAREAAGLPVGQVFHQNTNLNVEAPPTLFYSEAGALFAVERRRPTVGTWYSITSVATEPYVRSQNDMLMGRTVGQWQNRPEALAERMDQFGIGAVVTVEPAVERLMLDMPGAERIAQVGPFSAFVRAPGRWAEPGWSPAPNAVGAYRAGPGWMEVDLRAARPALLTLRRTWHPWWRAWRLDERGERAEELPVQLASTTGLISVSAPAKGTIELRYADPTRWTLLGTFAGGIAVALLWRRAGLAGGGQIA